MFAWQALGKYGILCLEDIVHEITKVGPHFKEITTFLGPFALSKPKGGLQGKKAPYKDGGDTGNREDEINDLIEKMNWDEEKKLLIQIVLFLRLSRSMYHSLKLLWVGFCC